MQVVDSRVLIILGYKTEADRSLEISDLATQSRQSPPIAHCTSHQTGNRRAQLTSESSSERISEVIRVLGILAVAAFTLPRCAACAHVMQGGRLEAALASFSTARVGELTLGFVYQLTFGSPASYRRV